MPLGDRSAVSWRRAALPSRYRLCQIYRCDTKAANSGRKVLRLRYVDWRTREWRYGGFSLRCIRSTCTSTSVLIFSDAQLYNETMVGTHWAIETYHAVICYKLDLSVVQSVVAIGGSSSRRCNYLVSGCKRCELPHYLGAVLAFVEHFAQLSSFLRVRI